MSLTSPPHSAAVPTGAQARPAPKLAGIIPGRSLTISRREALYAQADPTEVLPRPLPAAPLVGQLRVLELQRANLDREIARLRGQDAVSLPGVLTPPIDPPT